MKRVVYFLVLIVGLVLASFPSPAQSVATAKSTITDRFSAYTIESTQTNVAGPYLPYKVPVPKAVSLDLGHGGMACFDLDLLTWAVGWEGSLDFSRTLIAKGRGDSPARLRGQQDFGFPGKPGISPSNEFPDSRPAKVGPLPAAEGRFRGFYRAGDRIVMAYTADGTSVFDLLEFDPASHTFVRTLSVDHVSAPLNLGITTIPGARGLILVSQQQGNVIRFQGSNSPLAIGLATTNSGAYLRFESGIVSAHIPASTARILIRISIGTGGEPVDAFEKRSTDASTIVDPESFTHGGPARWGTTVTTTGSVPAADAPYAIDTIVLPDQNPWNSWMRISAFDFFPDGRAAVATLSGDVWIVSGIDASLRAVHWRRFATGFYEPLGVRIVHGQVYVLDRNQITRLQDLNNDGEADFYECFNDGGVVAASYHAFSMDLQTDSQGNFYYAVDGNLVDPDLPMHGCVIKVTEDGETASVYANGLRAANGMGIGPHDEITSADNQGHWTPACRINMMRPGGFYGYKGDPRLTKVSTKVRFPDSYDDPLCWIPMSVDNSSGGQVWVADDRWGPLRGMMLHTSYGQCSLMAVLSEHQDDHWQGAVWTFPLKFSSGIMRARFNPVDGQLYVSGLKGWQTSATKDGCFQRVRYTKRPVEMPIELHVYDGGIELAFSTPLNPAEAVDAENYSLRMWTYRWSKDYGSDDYRVTDPNAKGRDSLPITKVQVAPAHDRVYLEIPGLRRVMQYQLRYNLHSKAGTPLNQEINGTINYLSPGRPAPN